MIKYRNQPFHPWNLLQCHGSTFPFALTVAIPCALVSALLRWLANQKDSEAVAYYVENVARNNAVYTSFTFLCGFLIVFRTSQAYGRFWDGCAAMKAMQSEWLCGASSLIAFCRFSSADECLVISFQHMVIRLVSMLHACSLAQLEGAEAGEVPHAFKLELIDAKGIDKESLETVRSEECKVELIVQWLQSIVVDNIKTGVLTVPPPILSRFFHNISNGLHCFYDAYKISEVPYPFPYMQVTEVLLVLHWIITPIVAASWTFTAFWSGFFSFLATFILWALNTIATQLENPFGTDPNDCDAGELQHDMNERLLLLLRPSTNRLPRLAECAILEEQAFPEGKTSMLSFQDVWHEIKSEVDTGLLRPVSKRITLDDMCGFWSENSVLADKSMKSSRASKSAHTLLNKMSSDKVSEHEANVDLSLLVTQSAPCVAPVEGRRDNAWQPLPAAIGSSLPLPRAKKGRGRTSPPRNSDQALDKPQASALSLLSTGTTGANIDMEEVLSSTNGQDSCHVDVLQALSSTNRQDSCRVDVLQVACEKAAIMGGHQLNVGTTNSKIFSEKEAILQDHRCDAQVRRNSRDRDCTARARECPDHCGFPKVGPVSPARSRSPAPQGEGLHHRKRGEGAVPPPTPYCDHEPWPGQTLAPGVVSIGEPGWPPTDQLPVAPGSLEISMLAASDLDQT